MTNYRRLHTPGATWFFTVNLAERRSRLLVERIDTFFGEANPAYGPTAPP